jgi:ribosomal protein S18 acetylase RimI-like enzyme
MYIRPFRNTDPPGLAAIWTCQPNEHGIATCVTPQMLEAFVFSKPYFDREGLLIAEENGHVIGFAHAGFGPNESQTDISTEVGTTCLIMVAPDRAGDRALTAGLLAESEAYLRRRGAKVLYAGCINPLNPFYLGFYGGSELPGVMSSDTVMASLLLVSGYDVIDRTVMMECALDKFRAPVDRQQLHNRRRFRVDMETHATVRTWWEACTDAPSESARFVVFPTDGGPACGSVVFWIIEPLSTDYGRPTAGLTRLVIEDKHKRQGLATFLNSEAMRQLQIGGVTHVEVQTMQDNAAAIALYEKLGFTTIDEGLVLRKSAC